MGNFCCSKLGLMSDESRSNKQLNNPGKKRLFTQIESSRREKRKIHGDHYGFCVMNKQSKYIHDFKDCSISDSEDINRLKVITEERDESCSQFKSARDSLEDQRDPPKRNFDKSLGRLSEPTFEAHTIEFEGLFQRKALNTDKNQAQSGTPSNDPAKEITSNQTKSNIESMPEMEEEDRAKTTEENWNQVENHNENTGLEENAKEFTEIPQNIELKNDDGDINNEIKDIANEENGDEGGFCEIEDKGNGIENINDKQENHNQSEVEILDPELENKVDETEDFEKEKTEELVQALIRNENITENGNLLSMEEIIPDANVFQEILEPNSKENKGVNIEKCQNKTITEDKLEFLFGLEEFKLAMQELDDNEQTILKIDLSELSDIDDDAVNYLAKQMRSFEKLYYFSLDLRGTSITDEGLYYLSLALNVMDDLQVFQLWLSWTNITDEGFKFITSSLSLKKYLKKDLTISLRKTNISDASLLNISETFAKLKNLEVLWLGLENTNVSDAGIDSLCEGIKSLEALTQLSLHCDKTHLTDLALANFSSVLGSHLKWEKLIIFVRFGIYESLKNLILKGGTQITEEAVKEFLSRYPNAVLEMRKISVSGSCSFTNDSSFLA